MFGFPGETEEEFQETYTLLEEIRLYKIHVFPYSKREGTRAAEFKDQIPSYIKEERSKKVAYLSNKIGEEYRNGYIGKTVKVLIEEKQEEMYIGHTASYIYVGIRNSEEDIQNKFVEVEIKKTEKNMLIRRHKNLTILKRYGII